DEPARLVLLGGPPFGEQIVMWWNFVVRSHDEIVAFRDAWEAGSERFGTVEGYVGRDGLRGAAARLPAPALPHATIRPRGNPR
ncbi:MAG TPA: pirin-like C-terminal cupin domain-containing protein, partial [Actinomycetospora sp.]|nr:pirin-like C-terminal cupin domain-containing protein [Actinomycetospora sp.]